MGLGNFDKKRLSFLLSKALGDGNISEYSLRSGVSITYISELIKEQRDNPPLPKTLKKLADKAKNNIMYEDLMVAAGHVLDTKNENEPQKNQPQDLKKFIEQAEVMFDGELYDLDEEDKQKVRDALEFAFWHAKQKNKRKKP